MWVSHEVTVRAKNGCKISLTNLVGVESIGGLDELPDAVAAIFNPLLRDRLKGEIVVRHIEVLELIVADNLGIDR